jgi:hypothetical protein
MTERVIFVDFDGVFASERHDRLRYSSDTIIPEFDPQIVVALSNLCEKECCKIVIISTWADDGKDKVVATLKEAGFNINHLHSDWRVDNVKLTQRGAAIKLWCEKHGINQLKDMVILDDKDGKYSKIQYRRWIKPETASGLLPIDIEKIETLLIKETKQEHARKDRNQTHQNKSNHNR